MSEWVTVTPHVNQLGQEQVRAPIDALRQPVGEEQAAKAA
jgi:hypothetical protein